SFKTSAAISNCICAIRKGLSSSRGATRGTIEGTPLGRLTIGGFATVAIWIGPFRCALFESLLLESPVLPHLETVGTTTRSRLTFGCSSHISPGTPSSRNGATRCQLAAGLQSFPLRAFHSRDREPTCAPQIRSVRAHRVRSLDRSWPCCQQRGLAAAGSKKRSAPKTNSEPCVLERPYPMPNSGPSSKCPEMYPEGSVSRERGGVKRKCVNSIGCES